MRAVAHRFDDSESFEELAMPHFARLFNFACWLTKDRDAAEDLVQETYMKALKGFSTYQHGTNIRAWLYRILRNTFLTSKSGLKTSAAVSFSDEGDGEMPLEPGTAETPESLLLARVERETIMNALDELPVNFREIILLCDLEELTYKEIGQTLGLPVGTVMSRLSRARSALRTLLAAPPTATSPAPAETDEYKGATE